MANVVDLTQQTQQKKIIPPPDELAALFNQGDPNAPQLPPAGPPAPQDLGLTAEGKVPPVPTPIKDLNGVVGGLNGEVTPPPEVLGDITGSMASPEQPQLQPKSTLQKLEGKLPSFLKLAGAIGGGLEAAGHPMQNPEGAEMFQRTLEAEKNREMEAAKLQNVDIPLAKAHSEYFSSFNPTKLGVAQENTKGKVEAAQAAHRFTVDPNVGLFDNLAPGGPKLVPGSSPMGAVVTPEVAKDWNIPAQFIGKQMPMTFFTQLQRNGGYQFTIAQGAKGPATVNKVTGQARDLGLGAPASASAANSPVNVYRMGPDGKPYLTAISKAEQLKTGEPTANVQFAEQGPTSASRNMSQLAATIQPHLDTLRSEIQELAPYIGPVLGRMIVEGAAGHVGSTGNPQLDYKLGRLISDFKLAASAVGRTHFAGRTGLPASQYFQELFNGARSPEELMGVLDSVPLYIEGYSEMGTFTPPASPVTRTGNGPSGNKQPVEKVNAKGNTTSFKIKMNGKQYQYKGTGDTGDLNNYTLVK